MESIMVIISIVISFGITAALGFVIIPYLRKLKFGQTILEIGPSWHKSKQELQTWAELCLLSE